MLNRMRMFVTVSLAVVILGSSVYAAPVLIGKIVLNESRYEKFGSCIFRFFSTSVHRHCSCCAKTVSAPREDASTTWSVTSFV